MAKIFIQGAFTGCLCLFCMSAFADWRDFAAGFAKAAAEQAKQQAEIDGQLARQKDSLDQQHTLDLQRQREEQLNALQRKNEQIEIEKRRLAAEQSKKKANELAQRAAVFTGTGFFVSTEGYLVTNYHVVAEKTDIAIRNFKGKFYKAEVVVLDEKRDLALLKVSGKFPALRIVNSDSGAKGQRVMTVGYLLIITPD